MPGLSMVPPDAANVPGPGQYDLPGTALTGPSFTLRGRPREKLQEELPGPGQYDGTVNTTRYGWVLGTVSKAISWVIKGLKVVWGLHMTAITRGASSHCVGCVSDCMTETPNDVLAAQHRRGACVHARRQAASTHRGHPWPWRLQHTTGHQHRYVVLQNKMERCTGQGLGTPFGNQPDARFRHL